MNYFKHFLAMAVVMILITAGIFATGEQDKTGATVPTYTWEITGPGDPYVRDDLKYHEEWIEALNEKLEVDLGFRVNFVDRRIVGEFRNLYRIAYESGEGIDLVNDAVYNSYIGMWLQLNDLIDKYGAGVKKAYPDDFYWWPLTGPGGEIWGMPNFGGPNHRVIWVRKDLAEEAGVEIPDINNRSNITLEWWEDLFRAFVRKNPGKFAYQSDDLGWDTMVLNQYIGTGMCRNRPYYFDVENQQFAAIWDHPDFWDALWRRKSWFDNGWEDPDIFVKSRNERTMDLLEGYNVAHPQLYSYTVREPVLGYIRAHPGFENNLEPFLNGVHNYGIKEATDRLMRNGIFVMKHADNPDKLIQFFSWFFSNYDNAMLAKFGIEGLTYEIDMTEFGKVLTVPEEERVGLVQSPNQLVGEEVSWNWWDFDSQFLPAAVNEPYVKGLRLQSMIPFDQWWLDPVYVDLAPEWSDEQAKNWSDAYTYYRMQQQKLFIEKMPREEFENRMMAVIKEARKISFDDMIATYNIALEKINHRYE